ncbi:hypothetical protein JMJ35_002651 [Cladonia borealis]|uniref:CHY zinc finger domain protein n=1 Tax=Cladonia borealis TaxID=184061 RepID=A0AA39R5G7_9LECA|nr:hypothetical protein JMJ35_002651 [Cladonia borealis]
MTSPSGQGVAGGRTADPGSAAAAAPHVTSLPQRGKGYCRFYGTRNGCRAGDACPFIHDPTKLPQNKGPRPKAGRTQENVPESSSGNSQGPGLRDGPNPNPTSVEGPRFIPPPVDGSRVVSKPVSQAQVEDPREFQIKQLRRRFSPTETAEDGGTAFTFQLVPSDPDFPFEMEGLECVLHVPSRYPREDRPTLEVNNEEMGREWQNRVEQGFARLAANSPHGTLLGFMNQLDRQLESLLTDKKEEPITIIPNRIPGKHEQHAEPAKPAQVAKPATNVSKPPQTYTPEQLRTASQRREAETSQLEARLGRMPLFSKSPDGIAYTVPITPRRHADLPVPLQGVNKIKLFVPLLYPLQHCRIELQDVSRDAAKATEKGFERKVKGDEGTLMGHVNWLAQNMHVLATEVIEEPAFEADLQQPAPVEVGEASTEKKVDSTRKDGDDRSHIKVIPRPPEWIGDNNADDESSDSEYSDSYDSGDEDEDGGAALEAVPERQSTDGPERGISLSFPSLELYGIELLELVLLSITIKCERCKDTMDINNLRDKAQKSESCKKCAMPLSVGYRRELMHTNSVRAGYLDLEGCTVVDMLPSNFLPTCSECSTTYASPGVVSVRGESSMAVCRECHRKMSFKIPEVKFLLVSSAARVGRAPVRKKPKESLGIIAGQELPRRGRCEHYSKSYRWFRFSCCSKVFACDKCHDGASDHPNEHANRMICGFCSREQNYRPEDCGICHSSLIKKAGSGFWEGGKGTRDKTKMSRKDPRKYKRRPGGAVRKVKSSRS